MDNKLTGFEVSNFKKFDFLRVDNIGQINLITGDNNVGKTCLLEALLLQDEIKLNLSFLMHCLYSRGFKANEGIKFNVSDIENNRKNNVIGLFQKDIQLPILIIQEKGNLVSKLKIQNEIIDVVNSSDIEIRNFAKELEKYPEINSLSKNWVLFYKENELQYMVDITSNFYQQFLSSARYVPLVSLNDFFREDIIRFYNSTIDNLDTKKFFLDTINNIFSIDKIIDIQVKTLFGKEQLTIATQLNHSFHSITQYGSGFVRVFRIVLEMMTNVGGRMMVDEIDTGVHFLKMKDLWSAIFNLSSKLNIQIFATTHSSDCIKSLIEAAENNNLDKKNLRLIELEEFNSKSGTYVTKATTYDYQAFKFKIEAETNIRGGNVWQ